MNREQIDPQLPWGYWLTLRMRGTYAVTTLVDEDGREWDSVRDAFWRGRLRMRGDNQRITDHLLEIVHSFLVAKTRRPSSGHVDDNDHFDGHNTFRWFVQAWLDAEGLVVEKDGGVRVTAEGWSVAMMLDGTRPGQVRALRPSPPSILTLLALMRLGRDREEHRLRMEAECVSWPSYFVRQDMGSNHTIVFVRTYDHLNPTRRTVWSKRFADAGVRDRFYDWLCERADLWESWAEHAYEGGGARLSQHLLELLMGTIIDHESTPPREDTPTTPSLTHRG